MRVPFFFPLHTEQMKNHFYLSNVMGRAYINDLSNDKEFPSQLK